MACLDGRRPNVPSKKILSPVLMLPAALAVLVLSGCGKPPEPTPVAEQGQPAAGTTQPAEEAATAELAAKEEELAKREADLALKEREADLARREAELAKKNTPATKKPASTTSAAAPAAATVAATPPPPKPVVVPAGTKISAELVTPLSSKTNRRGDRIEARVLADVMVDGKRAIPTGAIVSGTVADRVSGSKEIGSTPMIGVAFDTLAPDADHAVAMSAKFTQAGKSEGGKDAAKIAGGAVAGAVIGHQVDSDKGSVIGGILGAAAGTAAAKNTGNEVELPAGTVISLTLDSSVEVKP
jgi:hypothetical protein